MCRKGEMLPSCPHTKNPQDVDNPVDNLGKICLSIYARHSAIHWMYALNLVKWILVFICPAILFWLC